MLLDQVSNNVFFAAATFDAVDVAVEFANSQVVRSFEECGGFRTPCVFAGHCYLFQDFFEGIVSEVLS